MLQKAIICGILCLAFYSQAYCQSHIGYCDDSQQVVLTEDGTCDIRQWYVVFEDNFDGNSLDFTKWKLPPQAEIRNYDHSLEYQWYANSDPGSPKPYTNNIEVVNGVLKLLIKKEIPAIHDISTDHNGNIHDHYYEHSSANINSKFKFKHGKFEIRCRIPPGNAYFPAFWLADGYPNQEIDIFEFMENDPFDHNMNIHIGSESCHTDYDGTDFSDAMHTFSLTWDDYEIKWYVDGTLKRTTTRFNTLLGQSVSCWGISAWNSYLLNKTYPTIPLSVIANVAVHPPWGSWPPNFYTPPINSMNIEYIRVYKRVGCDGPIHIFDNTQLDLSNDEFNYIIGSNITVGVNVQILPGQQVHFIAQDAISIVNSASIFPGSEVTISIDPNLNCNVPRLANDSGAVQPFLYSNYVLNQELAYSAKYQVINSDIMPVPIEENANLNTGILAYPNPTTGKISIEMKVVNCESWDLILVNCMGSILERQSINNEKLYDLDLNGYKEGIFMIQVFDKNNNLFYFSKIVKEN